MKKNIQTQEEIVAAKLLKDGYVDNFWAIKNHILRLGAVIYNIRNNPQISLQIDGMFGDKVATLSPRERVKNKKNFYYFLVVKKNGK